MAKLNQAWKQKREQRAGQTVTVTFARGLSAPGSEEVHRAAVAQCAPDRYESGAHFGFDGREFVVGLFEDRNSETYATVWEWSGGELHSIEDPDFGQQLIDLSVQIAKRGTAS